jgi:acyl-coenzyme A synthetase/AMP-(fatty) acid ligase
MIVERIYHWAQRLPDQPAVIWNDLPLTYLSFWNAIRHAYDFFAAEDLPAGGNAVILVRSLLDSWIIVMALRALGLTTVCVRSNEQTQSLRIQGAACLVTTQDEVETNNLLKNLTSAARIVIIPSPTHSVKTTDGLSPWCNARQPFGGHILQTSGTTGSYKKLLLRGELEDRRNQIRVEHYAFDRRTVYHAFDFELWTGTGFKTSSAVWHTGGCVVLDERKDNFEKFFSQGVNFAKFLPWQLNALLLRRRDTSVRPVDGFALCVGGGFLPANLVEQCMEKITNKLFVNYSSTEINSVRLHSDSALKDDMYWLMPTDAERVQIVDDDGKECQINQQGELRILSADVDCQEYLDDAEATAKMFRYGCFYPGDLAVKREDGRIRILGRVADVIVVKGEKLATAPLEQDIQRKLQVEEVSVFSGLTKEGSEELIIAIQSARPIPHSELEAIARGFPRFEKVRFSIRSDFPRLTGRRKINRVLLKKLVFDDLERDSDSS